MEQPHVVILPFPVQGHIKPMLSLAQLLCQSHIRVTFVNTHHNHTFLAANLQALSIRFPNFNFRSIPDGLPEDHPRASQSLRDVLFSVRSAATQPFRELLSSFGNSQHPVTCIIADGIMSFAIDVGHQFRIPVIAFRTFSACCLWVYLNLQKLVDEGLIPFTDKDMDQEINSVPSMEGLLRYRDLPGITRLDSADHPILVHFLNETRAMARASSLILNTFDDLEAPTISQISRLFTNTYTIGPIHTLLKSKSNDISIISSSLRQEDYGCIKWLDSQPSKSVVYVSFGSLVTMSRLQLVEFWQGLVHSGHRFLWVMRPDLLTDEEKSMDLEMRANDMGLVVGWAPQEEVLAHPSVGCFLTHSGWNSTLEAIWAGVPMICWPQIGDQQVNSRWVSEAWRIGVDMKDTCDRWTVKMMIESLMGPKGEEVRRSMDNIARLCRQSISPDGSSFRNLEKLIEDIRKLGT